MRLIVHGQQAFGKSVLEAILERGEDEVIGVYCAPDKEGRPADPLKALAEERAYPYISLYPTRILRSGNKCVRWTPICA